MKAVIPGPLDMESEFEKKTHLPAVQNDGFIWINLQKPSRHNIEMVAKEFGFHELNIEDSLSKNQLPKIERYEDHIFMVLHFATLDGETNLPNPSQVSFFVGSHYLVTIHQGELKPLTELFEQCKKDVKQAGEIMGKSSGYLFHSIVDVMIDDLLHIMRKVVGNLDDLEELVFDEMASAAKQISIVRREITKLRRVTLPMKRTLHEFVTRDMPRFSEEDLTSYFGDVMDHLEKVIESLEAAKETVDIYKDTDFMLSTEKSNKILGVLTIIFTLTIPASVLGTFFGMNMRVPGSVSEPWTFLGPYTTFIVIIIGSIVPGICMHLYFRKQGWIGRSY